MLEAVAWLLADGGRPHGRKGTVMAGADEGDAGAAVAVIGAGIMGSAMTRNLVAAGLTTRVWDRSASATGPLDPRHHTAHLREMLQDLVNHAREDIGKISEPKAQALFETTAEVCTGLIKAFDD